MIIALPFIITSPPTRRRRRIDETYLLIQEEKEWEVGTEVWCFTATGWLTHPDNGTYEMEDGVNIKITSNKISHIE